MQFNPVKNKEMLVFLCIGVHDGAVCLVVSGLRCTCRGSSRSHSLSIAATTLGRALCRLCFFLSSCFFSGSTFLIFLLPSHYPFFSFFALSTVITVWQVPRCPCVGAYGLVVRIANQGSVLLSRGWLITVEAPGDPRHPPSTQLNAVVNSIITIIGGTYPMVSNNYWSTAWYHPLLKSD